DHGRVPGALSAGARADALLGRLLRQDHRHPGLGGTDTVVRHPGPLLVVRWRRHGHRDRCLGPYGRVRGWPDPGQVLRKPEVDTCPVGEERVARQTRPRAVASRPWVVIRDAAV